MPPKSPHWSYFYKGDKQNSIHYRAHCLGCINHHRPPDAPIDVDGDGSSVNIQAETWFTEGIYTTSHTKKTKKPRKQLAAAKTALEQLKQSKLQEKQSIHAQFGRATISANLPNQWVNNAEVIKLFYMFRARADEVIPDRRQISGRILDSLAVTDGWSDNTRNNIAASTSLTSLQSYLIKLMVTNRDRKNGEGYCVIFLDMIDETERETGCIVVLLCTDNDGGSHKGRDMVPSKRPWILVASCCAHQVRLASQNEQAADIAEQATVVIGWINNHSKVLVIFKDVQQLKNGKILALILANLTRWTSHFLAFNRLLFLKDAFRQAAIINRNEIIAAQVGAEKNRREHCDILEDSEFWKGLQVVVSDIEPICYGTNINQSDSVRPDEVLLTLIGIYRHFAGHSKRDVASGMKKRIEKRWKALDQPLFIFALILNPYEMVSRFGDKAGISVFSLNTEFMMFYKRVKSRPDATLSDEESTQIKEQKEREVSSAFMAYLASTGPFQDWRDNKEMFQATHGDDPIIVWQQFLSDAAIKELADFAIMLLELCVNQAGAERSFSQLGIMKTQHRNRLQIPRLEKMAKVGADIRDDHTKTGLRAQRKPRQNHDGDRVKALLEVPQHADLLTALENAEDSDVDEPRSVLIRSKKDWRREMKKWMEEERESLDDDEGGLPTPPTGAAGRRKAWLPSTLAVLFGGDAKRPVDVETLRARRKQAFGEEERRAELVQAEYSDEPLDDGALEGSGDDFEG
ncbi:hypothetical protein BDZ89DRAFT_1094001 [Hymenopellis radicata]|nr:hypothetical protein BDZ89DRAFT_1094001 [Hymenopellis radicata]